MKIPDDLLETLRFVPSVENMPRDASGVYYLVDRENGEVVYIGKSVSVRERVMQATSPYTPNKHLLFYLPAAGNTLLHRIEREMIKKFQPELNSTGRSRTPAQAIGVYMPDTDWERLDRIVEQSGMKRGALLTFAVQYFLTEYEQGRVAFQTKRVPVLAQRG